MPLFNQMGERMIRWQEFEELVHPFLSTHSCEEIVMTAQALRLPFAFVPTASDLLSDEHLSERDFFERVETRAGAMKIPGAPFKMSETPLTVAPAPPRGSANVDVFVGELGYEQDDLGVFADQGVV
jgi:formyl-CoA transferase